MNAPIDISRVQLETARLILRPWKESDLEDFYTYARIDGVGEMAGWPHHQSIEDSRQVLHIFMEGRHTFAIVLKDTGKAIGSLGLDASSAADEADFQPLSCCEIGYVLRKDFWGRGLMPEAVQAALMYCFDDLKLDAIFCSHFKRNSRSRRVIEKCGFQYLRDIQYTTRCGTIEPSMCYVHFRPDISK